ncbi:protein adenylyltransferase SelO [Vibrio sp. RC27]
MSSWSSLEIHQRYLSLPDCFYSPVNPMALENPNWVAWNEPHAHELGFPAIPNEELLAIFSGQRVPDSVTPIAMKYTGHQFGVYNPQLGDGRGLLLGEVEDNTGKLHDIHLKGAGLTPYSRSGDGRAVLRSTLREYLASEAMHGLGIPTTRALGMIGSDTVVFREQPEQGAMLIRTSESHIRFGHFEYFYRSNQHEELKLLADNVIDWHFPELEQHENPYQALFAEVVKSTATLIAHWQSVGFAHGVMNTDNMSILGLTFDYGPFAFLDDYDPRFICNHSDHQGRYSFDMQPRIGLWNLTVLAQSFSPLVDNEELQQGLDSYEPILNQEFSRQMRAKVGLNSTVEKDAELFQEMFALMNDSKVDYTRFFRQLSYLDSQPESEVTDLFVDRERAKSWVTKYLKRCEQETSSKGEVVTAEQRCTQMRKVNPKYILRNYLAQQAIVAAEQGEYGELNTLMTLLRDPFAEHPDFEDYSKLPPQWGKELEISCSS